MNGKTFKKTFLKENPKKILDAQYVLVSSRIRRNGSSERRNIINMSKQLMPSDFILADWRMDSDEYYFQDQYSKQVKGNLALLAIIVRMNGNLNIFSSLQMQLKITLDILFIITRN